MSIMAHRPSPVHTDRDLISPLALALDCWVVSRAARIKHIDAEMARHSPDAWELRLDVAPEPEPAPVVDLSSADLDDEAAHWADVPDAETWHLDLDDDREEYEGEAVARYLARRWGAGCREESGEYGAGYTT